MSYELAEAFCQHTYSHSNWDVDGATQYAWGGHGVGRINPSTFVECIEKDYDFWNLNIIPTFRWLFSFISNDFNESYLKSRMCEAILGNNGFMFFKYFEYDENRAAKDLFYERNILGKSFTTQVIESNPDMKIGNQKIVHILEELFQTVMKYPYMDYSNSKKRSLEKMAEENQDTVLLKALASLNQNFSKSSSAIESFLQASADGLPKTVACLLNLKVDIDSVRVKDKMTALMLAAKFDHQDVLEILLNQGANTQKRNSNNSTALDIAKENKHWKCVYMLEKNKKK